MSNLDDNEMLNNFLNNPENFRVEDEDYEYMDQGKYYKISHPIDLDLEIKINGQVGNVYIGCYFDGDLIIYSMRSDPERSGFGKEALRLLSEKLNEHSIQMSVCDIEDEAQGFWEKMQELKYVV